MKTSSLETAVKSTLEEVLCINSEEINDGTTIKELGIDSMDFLDFIYKLEEKTDKNIDFKKIEFKDVESFTVKDLIAQIQSI